MSSVPVRRDMRYRKDLGRGIRKMRARRPIVMEKFVRVRYARPSSTNVWTWDAICMMENPTPCRRCDEV